MKSIIIDKFCFLFKTFVEKNLILAETYQYCNGNKHVYWIAVVYIYKGLLLAFGTFLAWETRHVTVPELNDSKYIGACIYNVVVVCFFGVPLGHVLPNEQTTLMYTLQSSLIIFCTTLCQCILFLSKVNIIFVKDLVLQKAYIITTCN